MSDFERLERECRVILNEELDDVSARLWAIDKEKIIKVQSVLDKIIKCFLDAPREGREKDEPEGARTIKLSDTLVNKFIDEYLEVTK